MADRVTIPAPLAAEIAADLAAGGDRAKRWQPQVEGPLLLLASSGWLAPGRVVHMQFDHGPVCLHVQGASMGVATPGFWLRHAWAPAGGVGAGPRPDIGDRALIRDVRYPDIEGAAIGQIATVDEIDNLTGRVSATLSDGRAVSYATEWAILPPEVTGQPTPGEASGWDNPHDDVAAILHRLEHPGPAVPVDPLTVDPDMYELAIHIPMAAFTTTPNDDPRLDQVVHHARGLFPSASATGGPAWPEDGPTQCPTCGAVDRDERRHRAHEDAETTLWELVRWLTTERDRLRSAAMNTTSVDGNLDLARSAAMRRVLDRLRDQGLDVDYLAQPDTREQT